MNEFSVPWLERRQTSADGCVHDGGCDATDRCRERCAHGAWPPLAWLGIALIAFLVGAALAYMWIVTGSSPRAVASVGGAQTAVICALACRLYLMRRCRRMDCRAQLQLRSAYRRLATKRRELERLNRRLRDAAITDPLTGAHNRRCFQEAAARLVEATVTGRSELAVMMIDIDRFKSVNDVHGHAVGDRVLKQVAALCAGYVRSGDVLARHGGEEFVIALPDTSPALADTLADRLREQIMHLSIETAGGAIAVTVSIGVAAYRAGEATLEPAIARADDALYRAKNDGRNRVAINA